MPMQDSDYSAGRVGKDAWLRPGTSCHVRRHEGGGLGSQEGYQAKGSAVSMRGNQTARDDCGTYKFQNQLDAVARPMQVLRYRSG